MNWAELEKGKAPVPFVPEVRDDTDVSNFEEVGPEDMHTEHSEPCHDKALYVARASLASLSLWEPSLTADVSVQPCVCAHV